MNISKGGKPINSVDSWFDAAPPKMGLRQWVDGRSAKELARAFCGSGSVIVPPELESLLNSNPSLGAIELVEGWPEHRIRLDSLKGETRNADLAALGQGPSGMVAVTIEAKADEPFGDVVRKAIDVAREGSHLPERIENLAQALFGKPADAIAEIRYQLVHGIAATLVLAAEKKAHSAVFVVYELHSRRCTESSLKRNANDLDRLASMLTQGKEGIIPGRLLGPLHVPGSTTIPSLPLYVGKAQRVVP